MRKFLIAVLIVSLAVPAALAQCPNGQCPVPQAPRQVAAPWWLTIPQVRVSYAFDKARGVYVFTHDGGSWDVADPSRGATFVHKGVQFYAMPPVGP